MKLLERLFRRRGAGQKPRHNRFRPDLESLGERVVPATRVWDPTAGSDDANVAANWVGGVKPVNGDTVVIPAGEPGIDFLNLPVTSLGAIQVDKGFTDYINLKGMSIDGGWIHNGDVRLRGDLTLTGGFEFGYKDGTDWTWPFVYQVEDHTGDIRVEDGFVGFTKVRVGGGVDVYLDTTTTASVGHVEFVGTATGSFHNNGSVTFLNDSRYGSTQAAGANNTTYHVNNIFNLTTGSLVFDGSAEVASWIYNSGVLSVQDGTVNVSGRAALSTFKAGIQESIHGATGTIKLTTSATLQTDQYVWLTGGSFQVIREGGALGTATATLDSPHLVLASGATLSFESDVAAGSGDNTLDVGDGSVTLRDYAWVKMTINFTTGSCDLISCATFNASTAESDQTTFSLNLVGNQYASLWKMIDANTTTGDFDTYLGVAGVPHYWSGHDLFVEFEAGEPPLEEEPPIPPGP